MKKYLKWALALLLFCLYPTLSCNKDDNYAQQTPEPDADNPDDTADDNPEILDDYVTLKALFDANPSNTLGWDFDDYSMASWDGVSLNGKRVANLLVSGKTLDSVPPEIADLVQLNDLDISDNSLKTLPPEIGSLNALKHLNASKNALDSIPREMSNLNNLLALNLEENALERIPQEVCDLEDTGTLLTKDPDAVCDGAIRDYEAMIALFEANPSHTIIWDLSDTSMQSWDDANSGFELNADGRVTKISGGQLSGFFADLDAILNGTAEVILPPEIENLTELTELSFNLSYGIKSLPPEIGKLKKLVILSMEGNKLTGVPPEIGDLQNLEYLYLSANEIENLPAEIGKLTALKDVRMDFNKIAQIPAEIGNLTAIWNLNLRGNEITSIPDEIGNISSLEILLLDSNKIEEVPIAISQLTSLVTLDLGENELLSIPPELENLRSIGHLLLDSNRLTEIPEEIGNLRTLWNLDITDNDITELPLKVCDLELTVSTQLSRDPEVFCVDNLEADYTALVALLDANTNPNLEDELDWDRNDESMQNWQGVTIQNDRVTALEINGTNNFFTVPPEIRYLTKLSNLNLQGNNLKLIYEDIGALTELTYLSLNNNKLLEIPEEIGNLSKLEHLILTINSLKEIPESFGNLNQLENLWLTGNDLVSIPQTVCDLEAAYGTLILIDQGVTCE
ncbi:MAG: leucine-rich repeat domain-containing protein [Aurantibacter sp.]